MSKYKKHGSIPYDKFITFLQDNLSEFDQDDYLDIEASLFINGLRVEWQASTDKPPVPASNTPEPPADKPEAPALFNPPPSGTGTTGSGTGDGQGDGQGDKA